MPVASPYGWAMDGLFMGGAVGDVSAVKDRPLVGRDRVHRRADDARLVAELRRDDRRAQLEVRQELVGQLADAAAHHDEVGGEQAFERLVVALQAGDVLIPGEVFFVTPAGGGLGLVVDAVDFEVSEFRVGDQDTVVDEGRADAGAECVMMPPKVRLKNMLS